jgi:uncharacterized protein YceH (UPF0502 family)
MGTRHGSGQRNVGSMLRELQHEHEVIHALLVDPARTTAETMLELNDFVECGPVFEVLREMENQLSQRTITQVVVRLKRKGQYDRRVIRRILSSDPTLALTHFQWACEEVKANAEDLKKYYEALYIVEKRWKI